jgi:hypothetical protein
MPTNLADLAQHRKQYDLLNLLVEELNDIGARTCA